MTLSWGHRPPELEPPPRPPRVRRLVLVAVPIVAIAVVLSTRPSTVDDPTRSAITALLDAQRQALRSGDLNGYLATLDPSRVALRTCENLRFEDAVLNKHPVPSYALGRTDVYRGYVRAWIQDFAGWRRIFVRSDGGHWYMTEPTTSDLGGDVQREFAGITVTATDAESDLIDPVGTDLQSVHDAVVRYAPSPPSKLFSVRIATLTPTTGQCFVAGTAQPGFDRARITLRDVWLDPDYKRMSYGSQSVLIHEALHWIQFDHSIDAVNAMDWWMVEGWPQAISQNPSGAQRTAAVCASSVPTYSEMRARPIATTSPDEVSRRYVLAAMLIERLATQYGVDAYWRLVDAFAKEIDATRAYQEALGTDGPSFYRAWVSDMQAHYC